MKIKCLTTFLDGADRYEKDDIRTVPDDKGAYFVSLAWALDETGNIGNRFVGESFIDIQNSTLGLGDKNG